MQLDDSVELEVYADAIAGGVAPKGRMQVHFREGVPRGRLLDGVGRRLPDAAIVVLPPLRDPDASLHGLLQSAARLGPEAVEQATQDGTALRDRARATGEALARAGRPLVVWMPASWGTGIETGDPGQQLRHLAAENVLGGWLSVDNLSLVILANPYSAGMIERSAGAVTEWQRLSIQPPIATLPEDAAWGSYAAAAASLRKGLEQKSNLRLTGLQLRLLVALLGLGRAAGYLLNGNLTVRALTKELSDLLGQRAGVDVADGVRRFLQARRPISREVACAIARVPDGHQALITDCLGEGGDVLEVDEGLREGLRARRPVWGQSPGADPLVHVALADYHQSLDGAPGPKAAWSQITHWLEKAHHLGLSGSLGAERWERLERPTRELYWDRARSLSLDHQQYLEAARLYQECIDRFDRRDAYSWHYLGYNLDRAGVRRKEGERAFRKAVELRPDHPWYNGRLVTFLIDQARFRAAQEEWGDALERMDPDGENVAESPWLAKEAHRWVVKAWLRFGEVRRARKVLDDIPEDPFWGEQWYQDLRESLEDAEEGLRLGESVYPSTTRMSERWIVPREVLMQTPPDHVLRSWFPGRVAAVDQDGIHLALAVPHEDANERRLISRTLTFKEWEELGELWDPKEGTFIFVAIYKDETDPKELVQILMQPSPPVRSQVEAEPETTLRYLRRAPA
jgi:tetratricopeptide (TPR) repeat protein